MDLALEAAPAASGGDELAAIVRALDRLLALAAAAPGAVAVHSGAGAEWPAAVPRWGRWRRRSSSGASASPGRRRWRGCTCSRFAPWMLQ